MRKPIIALLSNKKGAGRTSLVYHLAWMFADLERTVLAADLDPNGDLTAMSLDEERLEVLWSDTDTHSDTIFGALDAVFRGDGHLPERAPVEAIDERFHLLPGDLALAQFEDLLARQWAATLGGDERASYLWSAFWLLLRRSAAQVHADLTIVDVGAHLGAVARAALLAADFVIVPLAGDLRSIQGIKNLGQTLIRWRGEWQEAVPAEQESDLPVPAGRIRPLGYIMNQETMIGLRHELEAWHRRLKEIPSLYARNLNDQALTEALDFHTDPECLGIVRRFPSIMRLAREARKPIFHLKPGDGAMASHLQAVADARRDFQHLAQRIEERLRGKARQQAR